MRDINKINESYEKFRDNGQIEFITFHPSFSYEEFVEGVTFNVDKKKDEKDYLVKDGIFKKMCIGALYNIYKKIELKLESPIEVISGVKINFENVYDRLIKKFNDKNLSLKTIRGKEIKIESVNTKGNFIVRPFEQKTDRSYIISKDRLKQLVKSGEPIDDVQKIREIIGGCNASMFYSFFKELEKIKQDMNSENLEDIKEELEVELTLDENYDEIKRLVLSNLKDINTHINNNENEQFDKFVLIIDEINRGDISKIFGELITLLEEDKRIGGENQLTVKLPYSNEKFSVPPNLYLIGTMNTADRSIALIDIALRRRFRFKEMMPKLEEDTSDNDCLYSVKENELKDDEWNKFDDFRNAIIKLNKKISEMPEIGRDKQIGHSFLFKIKSGSVKEDIKDIWNYEIIPLLEEYCYQEQDTMKSVLSIVPELKEITTHEHLKKLFEKNKPKLKEETNEETNE